MKFERKAVAVVETKTTGARVGDKVIFSPHHKENNENFFQACGFTPNKIYAINGVNITQDETTIINDDTYPSNCGSNSNYRGHYDIVDRAEQSEPKFEPINIVLENAEDVAFLRDLIGAVPGKTPKNIFDAWSELDDVAGELNVRYTHSFKIIRNN